MLLRGEGEDMQMRICVKKESFTFQRDMRASSLGGFKSTGNGFKQLHGNKNK